MVVIYNTFLIWLIICCGFTSLRAQLVKQVLFFLSLTMCSSYISQLFFLVAATQQETMEEKSDIAKDVTEVVLFLRSFLILFTSFFSIKSSHFVVFTMLLAYREHPYGISQQNRGRLCCPNCSQVGVNGTMLKCQRQVFIFQSPDPVSSWEFLSSCFQCESFLSKSENFTEFFTLVTNMQDGIQYDQRCRR